MRTSAVRAGLYVGDAHDRSQRIRAMRGGHGVHVVDFAVRSAAVVVGRTVPAGESSFGGEGLGAGREGGLGEIGLGFRGLRNVSFLSLVWDVLAVGCERVDSVVDAGGGGGGTLTCACLGWPQALRNRIAMRTNRSMMTLTKWLRCDVAATRPAEGATWAGAGAAAPCSRRIP